MHLLIIFGIILILGLAAGRLFEKIGIPQVVGTIIIGVILGDSVTGLVHTKLDDGLALILYGFAYSFAIGAVLLCSGIASSLGFSLILSNMAAGMALTNLHSDRNETNMDWSLFWSQNFRCTSPGAEISRFCSFLSGWCCHWFST